MGRLSERLRISSKLFARQTYIARTPLGKYIILAACILHYGWAFLLAWEVEAAKATPTAVLVNIFGGRVGTVLVLVVVASLAFAFLCQRAYRPISSFLYGNMLFPQLWLLLMSASSGIYSAWVGHYADGVARAPAFILADQMPIVILCLLYGCAIMEIGRDKLSFTEPTTFSGEKPPERLNEP